MAPPLRNGVQKNSKHHSISNVGDTVVKHIICGLNWRKNDANKMFMIPKTDICNELIMKTNNMLNIAS